MVLIASGRCVWWRRFNEKPNVYYVNSLSAFLANPLDQKVNPGILAAHSRDPNRWRSMRSVLGTHRRFEEGSVQHMAGGGSSSAGNGRVASVLVGVGRGSFLCLETISGSSKAPLSGPRCPMSWLRTSQACKRKSEPGTLVGQPEIKVVATSNSPPPRCRLCLPCGSPWNVSKAGTLRKRPLALVVLRTG